MNSSKNKKLNREVHYTSDTTRDLYENGALLASGVDRDEAHRFLHGDFDPGDAAEPSMDEMLDAIAAKLRTDVERVMIACVDDPATRYSLYLRALEDRMLVRIY